MYRQVKSVKTRPSRQPLRLMRCWILLVCLTLLTLYFTYQSVTLENLQMPQIKASLLRLGGCTCNVEHTVTPAASVYMTKEPEIPNFVPLLGNSIYIYSAIGRNSTGTSFWDFLALNMWENKRNERDNYMCCLRYNSSNILSVSMSPKLQSLYMYKTNLSAKQYVCPNPLHKQFKVPDGVSLVRKGGNCSKNASVYVKPDFAFRVPNESISVCTKIAFGQLDASTIIEWFEVHKRMGVQKVITYTHQLNEAAMKALQYYVSSGIAELHPFGIPDTERFNRSVGMKNIQSWNDEQISVFDCNVRLAGYTYIGLIDLDEYVTPKKQSNWIAMLSQLRKDYPNAAGFTFLTEIYPSTWGKMDNDTDIRFAAYLNRTTPMKDREKSIIITARTQLGRVSTHAFRPIPGSRFKGLYHGGYFHVMDGNELPCLQVYVSASVATLKHYRACRDEWLRENGTKCYQKLERITDRSMVKVAQMVEGDIQKVKKILGLQN